ncbi:hypothetical protein E4T43_04099 [Aureobasidium subglaciale]|nr:hypothetical protein E4T43_04099 [Aureobasidium subglaciale]
MAMRIAAQKATAKKQLPAGKVELPVQDTNVLARVKAPTAIKAGVSAQAKQHEPSERSSHVNEILHKITRSTVTDTSSRDKEQERIVDEMRETRNSRRTVGVATRSPSKSARMNSQEIDSHSHIEPDLEPDLERGVEITDHPDGVPEGNSSDDAETHEQVGPKKQAEEQPEDASSEDRTVYLYLDKPELEEQLYACLAEIENSEDIDFTDTSGHLYIGCVKFETARARNKVLDKGTLKIDNHNIAIERLPRVPPARYYEMTAIAEAEPTHTQGTSQPLVSQTAHQASRRVDEAAQHLSALALLMNNEAVSDEEIQLQLVRASLILFGLENN